MNETPGRCRRGSFGSTVGAHEAATADPYSRSKYLGVSVQGPDINVSPG